MDAILTLICFLIFIIIVINMIILIAVMFIIVLLKGILRYKPKEDCINTKDKSSVGFSN
jgi:hypothetical protein